MMLNLFLLNVNFIVAEKIILRYTKPVKLDIKKVFFVLLLVDSVKSLFFDLFLNQRSIF